MQTAIEPWLSVSDAHRALAFYTAAFGAEEKYRLEAPDNSLVLQLSIQGASFWVSGGSQTSLKDSETLGGNTVRMILITSNPEDLFQRALAAGAKEIFPVGEEYGWKLGRVIDPFGLHWEIGHPLDSFYENKG
ncbi:MAG: VOC family protein [Chitinophagales bacterium]